MPTENHDVCRIKKLAGSLIFGLFILWHSWAQGQSQTGEPVRAILLQPVSSPLLPWKKSNPPPEQNRQAQAFPIDLATALRLAGANNLQIALAFERVNEARARLAGAQANWLPSLSGGVGYNQHEGQIQDTGGKINDVNRSSLYVGGGPSLGNYPVGAAGGLPRLAVDFSLSDALFAPLAQRQLVRAADAAQAAVFNDTLLQVALAYLDLNRAQEQVVVARAVEKNADELARLMTNQVKAGKALTADGLRVQAELADRRRQMFLAEEAVRVASAELVRLLRLDPTTVLAPADGPVTPISMVNEQVPLADLISQALAGRPEVREKDALAAANAERLRLEQWRPLFPNLVLGVSAGGYGGGQGGSFGSFGDRTDFDALMVWHIRNLRCGNRALQRERASQTMQANLASATIQDLIAAEVATAQAQVTYRAKQIDAARTQEKAATEALPLNFKGILGGELRAIEAQQAIQTFANARYQHLGAVIDYNRAQFLLLRALGLPLERPRINP